MSFGVFMALLTLATVALRWLLFVLFQRTDDGPSFLAFMSDPGSASPDPFKLPMAVAFLGIGALGWIWL